MCFSFDSGNQPGTGSGLKGAVLTVSAILHNKAVGRIYSTGQRSCILSTPASAALWPATLVPPAPSQPLLVSVTES